VGRHRGPQFARAQQLLLLGQDHQALTAGREHLGLAPVELAQQRAGEQGPAPVQGRPGPPRPGRGTEVITGLPSRPALQGELPGEQVRPR